MKKLFLSHFVSCPWHPRLIPPLHCAPLIFIHVHIIFKIRILQMRNNVKGKIKIIWQLILCFLWNSQREEKKRMMKKWGKISPKLTQDIYSDSPLAVIQSFDHIHHHFIANRWGNSGNSIGLYFGGSKLTADGLISAMKLKDAYSLKGKL